MTPLIRFIKLILQEYDSKCLKMYLITLKVFKICQKMLEPITKVDEGESNIPCPSTLEVTYSSVEIVLIMGKNMNCVAPWFRRYLAASCYFQTRLCESLIHRITNSVLMA
jgi:hypothetical protein